MLRRLLDLYVRDRRRAQAGATLVELLVSLVIIGLALVIVIGTFSTALLDATLAKRNTASLAATQFELDKIGALGYKASPQPYSECFATENSNAPAPAAAYQGACPDNTYTLRADVDWTAGPTATSQLWTVRLVNWPEGGQVGNSVSILKVDR